jgi:lipoic acid synthetase
LSSQQAVKVTKSTSSATASFSRLDALRQRLANEEEDLSIGDFAGGQPKSVVVRRKAVPRSAKILPKPKWLKVQPADSDNYRRLRKTVRESGLATVW